MFRLRRRLATGVAVTVVLPLAVRALRRASGTIESRHGPAAASARLRRLAELAAAPGTATAPPVNTHAVIQRNPATSMEDSMAELLCPKCQAPMNTIERNGVTIERCTECGGIFLDRGELERLETAEAPGLPGTRPGADPANAAPGPASGQALLGELLHLAREYRGTGGRRHY